MLKFLETKNNYFNYKIGLAGGLVMAAVVFIVNCRATGETTGAFTAAAKQGVYTFFFSGIIMKICSFFAIRISARYFAFFLATLIPSIVALLATYGVHNLRGTPMPLESTIPTIFFVIPSTATWAVISRRRKEKENQTE